MIASELVSALTMVGASASSGRLRSAPIASRRSLAAALRSVEGSNSMVTRLWPALLCELIETTPGVRATAPSITAVISLSIVSGRRAVVVGADGDDRPVDIRQLANLDAAKRRDAGDDDEEIEHDRQHRPADEERGDAGAARRCTLGALLRRWPSVRLPYPASRILAAARGAARSVRPAHRAGLARRRLRLAGGSSGRALSPALTTVGALAEAEHALDHHLVAGRETRRRPSPCRSGARRSGPACGGPCRRRASRRRSPRGPTGWRATAPTAGSRRRPTRSVVIAMPGLSVGGVVGQRRLDPHGAGRRCRCGCRSR